MKEYKDISELKEWDKNPRTISKDNFERLKKQIRLLGQYKPLIITQDGTVLGGNMRLKAYKELDIKDIWVSIVDAPTEEKKIEYALSDNDRAGQYESDQLADLIGNFPDIEWGDYSVDIKPPTNLKDLIDQFKEVIEDEVPDITDTPAVSKLGEVYQLGKHRLMCGDATKIEDVEKLMNGQKADMVFIDPPYGMDLDTDYSGMKSKPQFALEKGVKSGKKYNAVIGDNKPFDATPLLGMSNEVFLFGGDYYSDTLPKKGSWFVWDKRVEENMDRMFGSTFELVWSKQKHKREIVRIKWAGIFGTEQERDSNRQHPTQKPIQLASWFYKKFSKENDIIFDPYGGSGSFLIACEQTNRICYMMELDPKYCDVIRKRYHKFTHNNSEDGWIEGTPIIDNEQK